MPFTPLPALWQSLIFICLIFTAHTAVADSTEIFTGEHSNAPANNILFILDSSGSMHSPLPDGQSRMRALQQGISQAMQDAPDNLNIGLMRFGGDSQTSRANGIAFPVSPLAASATEVLNSNINDTDNYTLPTPPANTAVRDFLGDMVSYWTEYGESPIVDALYEGALYFRGETPDSGFLPPQETRAAHPASYAGSISCKNSKKYEWCNYSKGLCSDNKLRNCQDYRDQVWCEHKACSTATGNATYNTPITDACQQNAIILVADGEPSVNNTAATIRNSLLPTGTRCDTDPQGFKDGQCGAELVAFLAENDQNTALTGAQTVETYTIGLDVSDTTQHYLETLSSPRGRSFRVDSSDELQDALQQAMTQAANQTQAALSTQALSFSSPTYKVSQNGKLAHADDIYMPLFVNNGTGEWQGNLRKFKRNANGEIVGKNGRPAVNQQGELTDDAQCFWSAQPTGKEVVTGGAAAQLDPAKRQVFIDAGGDKQLSHLSHNNTGIRGDDFIRGHDEAMNGRWKDSCETENADSEAAQKATICHRPPGNPDNEHTLQIGASAVSAHLAHGDHEGECRSDTSQTSPTETVVATSSNTNSNKNSKKTTICHKPPGNPANAHTLSVGTSSVPAHLAHGDYVGECGSNTPSESNNEATHCSAGDKRKVAICHRPPGNTGNAHTLYLPVSAVRAHLAHGDYEGECENISEQQRTTWLNYALGYDEQGQARQHMGDIMHAKPVIIEYAAGQEIVLVGSNEGYLHAFDSTSGKEIWAFMPHQLLPNVKEHKEQSSEQHIYGVDGGMTVWQTKDQSDNQKVYAYFGLRRGGRAYYALDISNPDSPQLLWRIDPDATGFANIGQTWSRPTRSRWRMGSKADDVRDVLIFGGGYDAAKDETDSNLRESDQYGHDVYIVDALSGALLWSARQAITNASAQLKHSIPGDIRILDINNDGSLDRLYFADTGGQVWRVDIGLYGGGTSQNHTAARLTKLADLGGDSANPRMFFYEPDVAMIGNRNQPLITIALGSGYRAHPLDETMQDRFYVLLDEYVYAPVPDHFQPLKEGRELATVQQLEGVSVLSSPFKGWYYDLPHQAEKVLAPALTFMNKAMFTTFAKDQNNTQDNACSATGNSARTYVLNLLTGEAVADLNRDGQGKDVSVITGKNEILDAPQLIFRPSSNHQGGECSVGNCQQTMEIRSGKSGLPVIDATNITGNNATETADLSAWMKVIYWLNYSSLPDAPSGVPAFATNKTNGENSGVGTSNFGQ